jgi:hypothetical protein
MREVKAKLAKLLAEENIQIRHMANVQTASFDIKLRILTLPIFEDMSEVLYDLLTGHEVGHSLYTPCDGWEKAITVDEVNKHILNIVEDPRIERKIKNRFPGLRKSFVDGYRELMGRGFFGTDLNFSKMNILDRLNMHFKGGPSLGVPFDKSEQWMVRLVDSTNTFEDAVEAAKIIQMAYVDLDTDEFLQNLDELSFGSGEASDGNEIDMPSEGDDDEGFTTGNGDKVEGKYDAEDFDADQHDVSDGEVSTQENFENRKMELNKNDARDRFYFGLPKPIVKNLVIDHKRVRKELGMILDKGFEAIDKDEKSADPVHYSIYYGRRGQALPNKAYFQGEYNKFRISSGKIINYMVKEFERKKAADEYKRISVSKTGVLNVNALHSYQYEDDLFLKRAIVHDGKNHGLVMLLDWSASMSYHMENTIKQLLSLVWFCNKVNIPFEVYAFTSAWSDDSYKLFTDKLIDEDEYKKRCAQYILPKWKYKEGDAYFESSNFQLLNIVSSRASVAELNAQLFNLYTYGSVHRHFGHHAIEWGKYSLSSTPLVEAMVAMQHIVPNFRDHYKLDKVNFICLTDGDPNSSINAFYNEFKEDLDDTRCWTTASTKSDWIFDDPQTRRQWNVHKNASWRQYNGEEEYRWLVRLLKHRYGINTIGIFLDSGNRGLSRNALEKYLGWYSYNKEDHKKARLQCRKEGFATIQTAGYDEYYMVPMGSQEIVDDTSLPLEDGEAFDMTKGKLKSIFSKNQKRKFGNRILANRIMDLIA